MCKKEWVNIQTGRVLNESELIKLTDNAILKVKPELWEDLDLEKNEELKLDVFKYTRGSEIKLWWICRDCTEQYDMTPYHKVKVKCKCTYCRGLKVGKYNNLQHNYPEIARQWHPTNNEKNPCDYTKSSGEKVWWKCDKNENHEWQAKIADRVKGRGCPYCKNKKTNNSNCLSTTHPEISKYLLDKSLGEKYTYGSTFKTDWLCLYCDSITKNKSISTIVRKGFKCESCGDGFKFPEKVMTNILKYLDIDFKRQVKFNWSNDKIYDFYIPSLNLLLETHGGQHYFESTGSFGSTTTLKEQQENDKYKYDLAIENGINKYIVVDCRYSDFNFIKKSIEENIDLKDIIKKDLDWNYIFKKSSNSILKDACEIYNEGCYSTGDIARKLDISIQTTIKYLKKGKELGLCDYTPFDGKSKENSKKKLNKELAQFTMNGDYIRTFESVLEASEITGINKRTIASCASGVSKSAKGFIFKYTKGFNSIEELIKTIEPYRTVQQIEVVQLSMDGVYIKHYRSLAEAKENTGVDHSGITRACKGIHKQAGGFKWMYKEDYEKLG